MTESIIWPLPPPIPNPTLISSPLPDDPISISGDKPRPKKLRKLSPESTRPPPPLLLLPRPLSADGELDSAVRHLRSVDPHLSAVIDELEPLGLHQFQPPFLTLARSIIHQQLAPKAAVPTYDRFLKLCESTHNGFSPAAVLSLSADQLRQIGVSARKAGYLHDLARKFHTGVLSDAAIVSHDDRSLLSLLTMVEGIGTWSAHMFMIFSLHRPDVLPVGDAAVRRGVQILYGLGETPRPSQMEQLCERWRPYRSVGSWYMWRLSQAKAAAGPSVVGFIAGGHHQSLMMDAFQEAVQIPEWKKAMEEEVCALDTNKTWRLASLPPGKRTVGSRWVFTVKQNEDGVVERYKAQLMAQGYTQAQGIDYQETFALVDSLLCCES